MTSSTSRQTGANDHDAVSAEAGFFVISGLCMRILPRSAEAFDPPSSIPGTGFGNTSSSTSRAAVAEKLPPSVHVFEKPEPLATCVYLDATLLPPPAPERNRPLSKSISSQLLGC